LHDQTGNCHDQFLSTSQIRQPYPGPPKGAKTFSRKTLCLASAENRTPGSRKKINLHLNI
ncbi:hypothetical protein, partial [Caldithrix abyssi]